MAFEAYPAEVFVVTSLTPGANYATGYSEILDGLSPPLLLGALEDDFFEFFYYILKYRI